jgi:hypothetical protein
VEPCTYTETPATQTVTNAAGAGAPLTVTSPTGCTWTATTPATWITITPPTTGAGNGTVNFTVAANTVATARTGMINVGDKTVSVTQSAPCTYTVAPLSQTFTRAGGASQTITVTTQALCAWTATSNAPWITLNPVPNGVGTGAMTFMVGSYTGTMQRTGTLTIADKTFTVTQTN